MPIDKSPLYYGRIYHKLMDPQLAEARKVILDLVAKGSSILDIACGTGQLCFDLREHKQCRVVGIDISLRMLEFARKANPFQDVTFVHGDATDLGKYGECSFDYATLLMLLHELPRPLQIRVLMEAFRVAREGLIIIDSVSPLPKNASGIGTRIVEGILGRDHNPSFKAFLASGGIMGVLVDLGLPITVAHRSVFWRNCREVIAISKKQ